MQCSSICMEKGWNSAFCVDFHRLNAQTKKDSYPLPQIQEVLKSMAGATHFSTMDFKSRFWQVRMVPESQQYTAFMVGNLGFYEFTHLSFGLCNAPVTFQCLMQNTLGKFNLTYCVIYLDDVIVFGHMEEEHLECLHIIFEQFCKFNLKLKPSKCLFFNQRLYTLCIMFPMRGSAPAEITSMQWRSSLCQRPLPKFTHSADSWAITGTLSKDSLKLLGHSMMYLGKKSRWAQYSCQLRHRKW